MITTSIEYQNALDELKSLEARLQRIQVAEPTPHSKGFTKAGVRKLISRLHEELAVYEGSCDAAHSHLE